MRKPNTFLWSRLALTAIVMLLVSGCDDPVATIQSDLSSADAARIAVYQKLVELRPWEQRTAYCLSDGEGTSLRDPPPAVLEYLAADTIVFVPVSACALESGRVGLATGAPGPAQLLHIERIDIQSERATVSAFYQRSEDVAGGYVCELKRNSAAWSVESCGRNPQEDEAAIRAAVYRRISNYIPWPSGAEAYCLSEGSGTEQRDPIGPVMFRLVRSTGAGYFPSSGCTMNGMPRAPGNIEALRLHVERVERGANSAVASVSIQLKQAILDLRCDVTKVQERWIAGPCRSPARTELTEDEIAIRTALYDYIAVPRPDFADLNAWCLAELAVSGNASVEDDPPAAVMRRLEGNSREFLPRSACTLTRTPPAIFSVLRTPRGELAGWVHIDLVLRQSDRADAHLHATYPYGGFGWHCALESPAAQVWEVTSCRTLYVLN